MAAVRPISVPLPVEHLLRLRLLAERRGTDAETVAGHVLITWLDGPAQRELLAAVQPPRPRRPPRAAGNVVQLELEEPPPF